MEYSLDQISHKFSRILGAKDQIAKELHETQNRLDLMERNLPIIEKAQAYLQTKAQETQNQLSFRVEDITQMAIDTCFAQEEYQFKLQFTPKRNKTDAEIFLIQEDWPIDPLQANGGGLADLVAFGLRISAWTLERKNNTIWLDEPFKYLSEELKPLAGEILKELSTRLGVQFIIVTHDSSIIEVADTVINVSKKGGKPSKIKESIKN